MEAEGTRESRRNGGAVVVLVVRAEVCGRIVSRMVAEIGTENLSKGMIAQGVSDQP